MPLIILLLLGGVIFFGGLSWGLPSQQIDPFLFGHHPVWTGKQIQALLPIDTNPDRPGDVTAEPLLNRDRPILLNANDADRAHIIRRYRLFSYQPDEITTFMGLSRMNPRHLDFDPRMYQYGGLWFYPVGALLKTSSLFHLIDLRSDPAFYLDHPEAFARFYLVDRSYTACWAIAGIFIVYLLMRRLGGDELEQFVAALGFIFLPVVIYTAHEAKPHLPGAVLALLAILMAIGFAQTGRSRYAIAMILCCGLACSMVLTNIPLLLLIPIAYAIHDRYQLKRSILGMLLAVLIYLFLNPYIPINLIFHRARLFASYANTAAMYHFSFFGALGNALHLMIAGDSLFIFLIGLGGLLLFIQGCSKAMALLLIAGLLEAIPYFTFAADKPAEYGRFAILPDLVFMLLAFRLAGEMRGMPTSRLFFIICMLVIMGSYGLPYWRGYLLDTQSQTTRMQLAADLAAKAGDKNISIALDAEPAPYSGPPMNLFDWKWILLPRGQAISPALPYDFYIAKADTQPTPMSWANKQFTVIRGNGQ